MYCAQSMSSKGRMQKKGMKEIKIKRTKTIPYELQWRIQPRESAEYNGSKTQLISGQYCAQSKQGITIHERKIIRKKKKKKNQTKKHRPFDPVRASVAKSTTYTSAE